MSKAFSHEKSSDGKDEWLTPKYITDALGPFDLDPCSPIIPPWKTAEKTYNQITDGLSSEWGDSNVRVWMNPPYGTQTKLWMEKLSKHKNGIALIFSRTETSTFFENIWPFADSIFFFQGRLCFHHVDGTKAGTAGAPSCLICYGRNNTLSVMDALENNLINGILISLDGSIIRNK
jgi:hypothetical protein